MDIYWRVLKLETLEAGKETAFETTAGSRWSFRRGDDVLKSVRVGRAARNVYALPGQSFDAHPVEMTFVTPSDARVVFDAGEGEVEYEGDRARPGRDVPRRTSGAPTMRWATCSGRLL